jgi:hypothetical protein
MRGGKREGAGRRPGSENRDTAAARAALSELTAGHVAIALAALADIAENGTSEAARVSAATAILDRTFGRPRQIPFTARLQGVPVPVSDFDLDLITL